MLGFRAHRLILTTVDGWSRLKPDTERGSQSHPPRSYRLDWSTESTWSSFDPDTKGSRRILRNSANISGITTRYLLEKRWE